MRRREPTLDPAAEAELQALEAALAGDPAAEPVLAVLVRDVRAEAPTMAPAFRARLDNRVERGFERPLPRRRFALRPMIPALGVAGCVVAGIVAIALTAGGGSNDGSSSSSAAAAERSRRRAARSHPRPPTRPSAAVAAARAAAVAPAAAPPSPRRPPRPHRRASAASSAARAWS